MSLEKGKISFMRKERGASPGRELFTVRKSRALGK